MTIIASRPKLSIMSHLTQEQRYTISRMLQAGCERKEICIAIGKDKSVLSRELRRNSGKHGYSAVKSDSMYRERKERFKRNRKFTSDIEKKIIRELTEEQWSPEQIVGKAKKDNLPMVSHERIYQYIRKDKKEGGSLYKNLRHRLKHRKKPVGVTNKIIKDKLSINERDEIINNKERMGDWEIDTIVGKGNKGAIVTITERQTGFLLMKKLAKGKNAKGLSEAVYQLMLPYKNLVHSITSDNGTEFCEHKEISKKLGAKFYFANPYSSWERGLNEYTNKLIRQYIPKKESFDNYDDLIIKNIQYKINRRPRKKLNFDSPKNIFFNKVAFVT